MEFTRRWLIAALAALIVLQCDADTNISFVFMNSAGDAVDVDTAGVVPAVDMALSRINNNSSVLPGYSLEYGTVLNSECDRVTSLDRFFESITTPPNKYFLLGCGCDTATDSVGVIAHFWEIIHLAYATQSPSIEDRDLYPTLYNTLPTSIGYVDIIIELMEYYGWKRLAVIAVNAEEFVPVTDLLEARFAADEDLEANIVTFRRNEDISDIELFNVNYRIQYLNMHSRYARRVLCEAYKSSNERRYPNYIWIILGSYPDLWWTQEVAGADPFVTCTDDQLKMMLEYSLVINNLPTTDDVDATTDVGMTTSKFMMEYDAMIDNTSATFAAPYAYDALWAMALATDSANLSLSLEDFDNDENAAAVKPELLNALNSLSFTGITGTVSFTNGSRTERRPRVLQYRSDNDPVVIATSVIMLNNSFTFVYVDNESNSTTWPEIIPYDGSPLTEMRSIILPVFIIIYIGAIGVIIFAIACAVVNFVLRKRKVIRLTSPNLNYLIVLGAIVLTSSAFFYAYPFQNAVTLQVLCYIRAYTQNVGYSLCFGTICAKMWRVYYIFTNVTPNRKRRAIKDWILVIIVLIFAAVDFVYISISLAIDREYLPVEVDYTELDSDTNEYGIEIQYKTLVCDSPRSTIWIAIILLEKFFVQAAAVFFAIKTRKVKIRGLNDAKEVSIIIYVTSVVLTVMIIAVFALDRYLNADAAVFCSGLIAVTLLVLLLLFIPKWYQLYKDPKGEFIFERTNTNHSFGSSPGDVELTNEMKKRIDELESRLKKYEDVVPFSARKRLLSTGSILASDSHFATRSLSNAPLIRNNVSPAASLPVNMVKMTSIPEINIKQSSSPPPVDSGVESKSSSKATSEDSSPKDEKQHHENDIKLPTNSLDTKKLSFSDKVEMSEF